VPFLEVYLNAGGTTFPDGDAVDRNNRHIQITCPVNNGSSVTVTTFDVYTDSVGYARLNEPPGTFFTVGQYKVQLMGLGAGEELSSANPIVVMNTSFAFLSVFRFSFKSTQKIRLTVGDEVVLDLDDLTYTIDGVSRTTAITVNEAGGYYGLAEIWCFPYKNYTINTVVHASRVVQSILIFPGTDGYLAPSDLPWTGYLSSYVSASLEAESSGGEGPGEDESTAAEGLDTSFTHDRTEYHRLQVIAPTEEGGPTPLKLITVPVQATKPTLWTDEHTDLIVENGRSPSILKCADGMMSLAYVDLSNDNAITVLWRRQIGVRRMIVLAGGAEWVTHTRDKWGRHIFAVFAGDWSICIVNLNASGEPVLISGPVLMQTKTGTPMGGKSAQASLVALPDGGLLFTYVNTAGNAITRHCRMLYDNGSGHWN
jgi:hypothetical protein